MSRLQKELEGEKQALQIKRTVEKQAALKVIKENLEEKLNRQKQAEASKREEARLIELQMKQKLDLEERRVQEF